MAKYSKIVHAFEPNPVIFNDIKLNLSKIIKNINFYNYALSDHEKNSILKVPIRNKDFESANHLSKTINILESNFSIRNGPEFLKKGFCINEYLSKIGGNNK